MTPQFELVDVWRVFPGKVTALGGVSLSIKRGEYLVLMGPSGSGKTTLLNILGLLDTPTQGHLIFDGDDTSTWDDGVRSQWRRTNLSFVFQTYQLLEDRTVWENVEIGVIHQRIGRRARIGLVGDAIEAVGLEDRRDAAARTLSGGEQQRASIARAIARRPKVLLCDEPVGNLDDENAEKVLGGIGDIHRSGVTVVMVTHDRACASRAQRVVDVVAGRVVS